MKPEKIRRLLIQGLQEQRVTRVWRDAYDSAFLNGFIIALTDDWVVMHVLDDGVYLDDVRVLRSRDISTVRDGHNAYVERALQSLGTSVAQMELPSDVTISDLLLAAADLHPLLAFALGDEDDEVLMVGHLIKMGKSRVRLRFLRPDGTWADDVDRWRYELISSIQIGGRYLDALAQFGDRYPGDSS